MLSKSFGERRIWLYKGHLFKWAEWDILIHHSRGETGWMLLQPFTTNILMRKRNSTLKKILQEKNNVSCRFWLSDMNCVHCSEFVLYDDCGGDLEKKKWEKAGMCIGWVHTHPLKGFRAITHSLRFWRLIEGRKKASCWMLRQVWKACQSWPNSPLSISGSLCRTLLKVCIIPSTVVLWATYKFKILDFGRLGVYPYDCRWKFEPKTGCKSQ